MSKLEGRKVKLVKSTNEIQGIDCPLNPDLFHVGFAGVILRVYCLETNGFPIVVTDSVGRSDIYKPEQLRYLNNKPVVLP